MGLPVTGVELVAQGRENYLNTIQDAAKANSVFDKTLISAGNALKGFSVLGIAAAGVVGGAVVSAIGAGVNSLMNFSRTAIDSASRLQDVQLNLESLTAAELLSSGASDNMTEALAAAGPIAGGVMEKLKELSLASPFQYEQILQVYQLNKAFGQSTDMSLELTKAITNLAAANKSVPGITERLAYNFSQMAMTGQITARDMRDLAMAGVNLEKVFSDQLSMSVDEVNEKLKSGEMTFEEVSKSFASYVDKYFGTAAERAAKTFSGLKSSFADLAFFSSIDIFGGSLDVVTGKLSGLFDKAQEFIQAGGLAPIGAGLTVVTEGLFSVGETALQAGQNFFDNFGGKIMETANSALEWGANVTIQLAAGIIEGAAAGLTMAMDYVSNMLSYFLSPGSPPRVAPNIDRWGTSAMQEFLGGFTDADFSALNAVESGLNSALGALTGAGLLSKEDSASMFQDLSKQVTSALAGEMDLSPVLDNIRAGLGDYGSSVAELVTRQLALAAATNKVKKAEEDLQKFRDAEEAANNDLVRIIDDYNAAAKAGADPATLAAKREEFLLAKKRRDEAAKGRKQSEQDLATGKKEMEGLKEKASLQSSVVAELVELTKVQKELTSALKGGAGAKAGGGKISTPKPPELPNIAEGMQKKIEEIKTEIKNKLKDAFKPLSDAFENAKKKIEPSWIRFKETIGKWWEDVKEKTAPVREELKKIFPPEFTKNLGVVIGFVAILAVGFGILVGAALLVAPVIAAILSPVGLLIGAIALLATVVLTHGQEAWTTILLLGDIIRVTFARMWADITAFFTNIGATWSANWAMLKTIVSTKWEEIKTAIREKVTAIQQNLTTKIAEIKQAWTDGVQALVQGVRDRIERIKSAFGELIEKGKSAIREKISDFLSLGKDMVYGIVEGVKSAAGSLFESLRSLAMDALAAAKNALGIESPSTVFANMVGAPIAGGIAEGILSGIGGIKSALSQVWSNITGGGEKAETSVDTSSIANDVLPSLQTLSAFLSTNLAPLFTQLNTLFQTGLLVNLTTLATFITTILLPTFMSLWTFMSSIFSPTFMVFDQFLAGQFIVNLQSMTDVMTTGVLPAQEAIGAYMMGVLTPAVQALWVALEKRLKPTLTWMHGYFVAPLIPSMERLYWVIEGVRKQVLALAAAMKKLQIPAQLESHSPSPFEVTLNHVRDAMHKLNYSSLPSFQANLDRIGDAGERAFSMDAAAMRYELMAGREASVSETRNYNLEMKTNMDAQTVKQGFEYFRLMGA